MAARRIDGTACLPLRIRGNSLTPLSTEDYRCHRVLARCNDSVRVYHQEKTPQPKTRTDCSA